MRAVCCEANDTQIFCVFFSPSLSLLGEEGEMRMTMTKKREREMRER
jgi:hypothetical protein